MKQTVTKLLIALGIILLLALTFYVTVVMLGLKAHNKEDRIVFGSRPLRYAIWDYYEKHGGPPQKLDDLVPEFIQAVPTFPEASKVTYQVHPDGTNWTLDLHWQHRKTLLIYRRTSVALSDADTRRYITTIDGGFLLKEAEPK